MILCRDAPGTGCMAYPAVLRVAARHMDAAQVTARAALWGRVLDGVAAAREPLALLSIAVAVMSRVCCLTQKHLHGVEAP